MVDIAMGIFSAILLFPAFLCFIISVILLVVALVDSLIKCCIGYRDRTRSQSPQIEYNYEYYVPYHYEI